jgi:hypothetical protein
MVIGKVYKIITSKSDECYIGSTFGTIENRFEDHKWGYTGRKREVSLYGLFDDNGIDSCQIVLIRDYDVFDQLGLFVWEAFWIDKTKLCVNARLPIDLFCGKCAHGRQRSQCKECGGSQICDHERIRSRCKECGGSQICDHGRRREICKECGGSQICDHGRRREICKECGGSQICDHGRLCRDCKECGGSQICDHGRHRRYCKECNGEKYRCEVCDMLFCGKSTLKKHYESLKHQTNLLLWIS